MHVAPWWCVWLLTRQQMWTLPQKWCQICQKKHHHRHSHFIKNDFSRLGCSWRFHMEKKKVSIALKGTWKLLFWVSWNHEGLFSCHKHRKLIQQGSESQYSWRWLSTIWNQQRWEREKLKKEPFSGKNIARIWKLEGKCGFWLSTTGNHYGKRVTTLIWDLDPLPCNGTRHLLVKKHNEAVEWWWPMRHSNSRWTNQYNWAGPTSMKYTPEHITAQT